MILGSLLLLLSSLVAAPASGDEAAEAAQARLRAEAELLAKIPPAVDRGVAWLEAQQKPGGSLQAVGTGPYAKRAARTHRFGKTALATLTLAHCGRTLEDPYVAKAIRYLRRSHPALLHGNGIQERATYSLAIYLMALFELHDGATHDWAAADGEHASRNPLDMPAWARAAVLTTVRWFLRTRSPNGLFGYPTTYTPPKPEPGAAPIPAALIVRADLSNTQYALLGLWAGARCGEAPPEGTLESLAEALLSAQVVEGPKVVRRPDAVRGRAFRAPPTDRARGFGYLSPQPQVGVAASGSMTAGGLSSLLVIKAMLEEANALDDALRARLDQATWDAIAWLTQHYSVERNTFVVDYSAFPAAVSDQLAERGVQEMGGAWHAYYLYGLQRAMVIGGKRFLGDHDWYLEGAQLLLDTQAGGGSWRKGTARPKPGVPSGAGLTYLDPLVDTCFALLFLNRATLRPRSPLLR